MRHLPDPALIAAVLLLSFTCDATPDEISPDRFDQLCRELISQVAEHRDIRFAESSAELGRDALGVLDEIVEIATDCPALSITVTGHTDNSGNEHFNLALSRERAKSVVNYLKKRGLAADRLTARGAGSQAPKASNDLPAGRQENRRIEFELRSLSP
jgi:outer membrane protein OmpA-like peptidoglycan-associated protein